MPPAGSETGTKNCLSQKKAPPQRHKQKRQTVFFKKRPHARSQTKTTNRQCSNKKHTVRPKIKSREKKVDSNYRVEKPSCGTPEKYIFKIFEGIGPQLRFHFSIRSERADPCLESLEPEL